MYIFVLQKKIKLKLKLKLVMIQQSINRITDAVLLNKILFQYNEKILRY